MKKFTLLLLAISMIVSYTIKAQVAINTDGSNPDSSAILDLKSTDKGLLPPRMTQAQRDAISIPVAGLQIFNTTTNRPNYYNGSEWMHFDNTLALVKGNFYQGGVIFYIDGNGGGLVCAIEDQNGGSGIQWYNGSYTTTGATGTLIGTGQTNTGAILNHQGAGSYAAMVCYNYVVGAYSDWFLPSQDELNEMYQNKTTINTTAQANGGSAFVSTNYWSSSEANNTDAVVQNFSNGSQYYLDKSYLSRVRAVRAF